MRATITLLVVVVVASQEPSPGQPPCQAYTTNDNEEKIPVPEDQKELDLWFSFQERECEVHIAVVTTKGEQATPLKVNIKQRTPTQKSHFWGSSSSHDEDNTSWCRVRLTQAVKVGQCDLPSPLSHTTSVPTVLEPLGQHYLALVIIYLYIHNIDPRRDL
nr:uncharacterized protein LOC123751862 [Procambarus clarkii]